MALDAADITIPADLLPADGRFGSGPSKVRHEQVASLAEVADTYMGTSHRQKTVKSQVGRLRSGLADLFALPDGYEVVLGNGGTTAFWEVATFGLVRDRAQFLSFGEFGGKFVKSVQIRPVPGRPHRQQVRSRQRTGLRGRGRRRCLRHPAQRDLDRGGDQSHPCRRRRLRRADAVRRDICGRWPVGRCRRDRCVLLRPPEVVRQRRWPVVGTDVARGAGARTADPRHGPLHPGVPEPDHGHRQLA